jgi:hypothetical protein
MIGDTKKNMEEPCRRKLHRRQRVEQGRPSILSYVNLSVIHNAVETVGGTEEF